MRGGSPARSRPSISPIPTCDRIRDLLAPDVTLQRVQMVEVYRIGPASRLAPRPRAGGRRRRAGDAAGSTAAPAADRLAAQALTGSTDTRSIETLDRRRSCCMRRRSFERKTAARPASWWPPTT